MPQVNYSQILKLRSDLNVPLLCEELNSGYALSCYMLGQTITSFIPKLIDNGNSDGEVITNPDLSAFVNNILPLCNAPLALGEVRFYTHDFADASTWHSKTCGDASAPYVGGVMIHPLTGLWMDATGAGMVTAYSTPDSGYYQNPAALYGALNYLISAQYDDVNYRWVDSLANSYLNDPTNHAFTTYCALDLSPTLGATPSTAVWKNASGTTICSFDPTLGPDQITNSGTTIPRGSWICTKPDASTIDATSSRWRVDPYDGRKIDLRAIGMSMELDAQIVAGKVFRWKAYGMPSAAQQAGLESMGLSEAIAKLPYQGLEFTYNSVSEFRYGVNDYYQSGVPEVGCTAVTVSLTYNYTKTVIPSIKSSQRQRFDIVIDDHLPINKTKMARGTFIAVTHPDF
jgi:hypothetical protein